MKSRTIQPPIPDIAIQILKLWWRTSKQRTCFQSLRQTLPFIGASCGAELVSEILGRSQIEVNDRTCAGEVLGYMGATVATEEVLNRLADYLRDSDSGVSWSATESLSRLGRAAATEKILARLTNWLRDTEWENRDIAAVVLGRLGAAAATEAVLNCLTEWLGDQDPDVRSSAASALGYLGPVAASERTIACLSDCQDDSSENVRRTAEWALAEFGPKPDVREVEMIKERKHELEPTPNFLKQLALTLRDPDSRVRTGVADTLKRLGPAAATDSLLALVTQALQDREWYVRKKASEVLRYIGRCGATPAILERLIDWLYEPERKVRMCAAETLVRLDAATNTTVLQNLIPFLTHAERRVRERAKAATEAMLTVLMAGSGERRQANGVRNLGGFDRLLRAGVRWFPNGSGKLRVSTVTQLSSESETARR